MDTKNTPDLRYPEGSDTVWTATEPGFYALFRAKEAHPRLTVPTARIARLATPRDYISQPLRWDFFATSYAAENALLGPYDTPEEARAALKLYGIMLALGPYPHAVFEEPDGTTTPLGYWVNQP